MTELRPHGRARAPEGAAVELCAEVAAGRLDREAVDAVLRAAAIGSARRTRTRWPRHRGRSPRSSGLVDRVGDDERLAARAPVGTAVPSRSWRRATDTGSGPPGGAHGRLDHPLDLAGGDAVYERLHDHGDERLLASGARLQEAREVAPLADPIAPKTARGHLEAGVDLVQMPAQGLCTRVLSRTRSSR
jgi:hypothetical protein